MANHVHLLLTPPSAGAISAVMKQTNQRYAQVRNQRRDGSGKLFDERFSSKPICSEEHLSFCVLYINANPYRAGLKNRTDYPWSSHAFHSNQRNVSRISASMITVDSWYLALGKTYFARAAEYRRVFASYLGGEVAESEAVLVPPSTALAASKKRLLRPNGRSAGEAFLRFGRNPLSFQKDMD